MLEWTVTTQEADAVAVTAPWSNGLVDEVGLSATHYAQAGSAVRERVELTITCGGDPEDEDAAPDEGFAVTSLDATAAAALGAFLTRWAAEHGA